MRFQANHPRISIVVCTYNRADILGECISSLVNQHTSEPYEVLVVNNNSTDTTQKVIDSYSSAGRCNCREVLETQQGLSHARNRGYLEAQSEYVAYIDDDAKATPNFVEQALKTIARFDFDCFGGIYLPWYKFGRPKWYRDQWASNAAGKPAVVGALSEGFFDGGVMVFKKSVLAQFHGFSHNLGMKGGKVAYGEETQLQNLLRKNGFSIGFDPELRIEHLVPRYKLHASWFLEQAYAVGRDSWDTFGEMPRIGKLVGLALSIPRRLATKSLAALFRLFKKDYYPQNAMIDSLRPCYFRLGQLRGGLERLRDMRRRKNSGRHSAAPTDDQRLCANGESRAA